MRIHPLVEQARRLALARGVDARKQDDDRERGPQELLLDVQQFRPQHRNLRLVLFLLDFSSDLGRLEHPVAMVPHPTAQMCAAGDTGGSYCEESSGTVRGWPLRSAGRPTMIVPVSLLATVN